MPDRHPPRLDPAEGKRLAHAEYHRDFDEFYPRIYERDSWKLERRQDFEEWNNPSWEAVRRGEWDQALGLLEDQREGLRKSVERDRRQRTVFRRVRVVEKPFIPYIQWELHSLRIRAECREVVRVVDAASVTALEPDGPLPEMVLLGGQRLYNVVYTGTGFADGAILFTDPDIVSGWEYFVRTLFDGGEDIAAYVEREVAHLPPPQVAAE
jgi:uncharacterized protein DUF6879